MEITLMQVVAVNNVLSAGFLFFFFFQSFWRLKDTQKGECLMSVLLMYSRVNA